MKKRSKKKKVLVDRELLSSLSLLSVPTHIFRGSDLGVLEAIVAYLKEEKKLTYHQMAIVLDRDERNIWTVYSRGLKKRGKK